MTTATLSNAKPDVFGKLRAFATALYAAHGGWTLAGKGNGKLALLGASYENYAPALAAELAAIDAQR